MNISLKWCIALIGIIGFCFVRLGATGVGEVATDFTIKNHSTGGDLKLSDYAGQVVVLDFFAWWCGPCKSSSPLVVEDVENYFHDRGGNDNGVPLTVIGVNIESELPDLTDEFISDAGMTLVADDTDPTTTEWDLPAFAQFTVSSSIPLFVVINGVEGSTSHTQWEVVYVSEGFPGTDVLRTQINSVQAAASVADTTAPVITLSGDVSITITLGGTYTEAGASATDDTDGDVSEDITVGGAVDTSTVGNYTLTYDVSDAAGNAATQVTRAVTVEAAPVADTTAPVITLNGDASVTVTVGESYIDDSATASDDPDGTLPVTVSNPVDTSVPGTYTVTYTATDSAGNTTSATRTVVVSTAFASAATNLGGQWFYLSWFGAFYIEDANWIFHSTLGWLYLTSSSTDSVWLYFGDDLGWIWTNSEIYPLLSQESLISGAVATWLYYHEGSSDPRYFYNYNSGAWEEE